MPAETKIAGTSVAMESALLLTTNEGCSVQSNMKEVKKAITQQERNNAQGLRFTAPPKKGGKNVRYRVCENLEQDANYVSFNIFFTEISSWVIM